MYQSQNPLHYKHEPYLNLINLNVSDFYCSFFSGVLDADSWCEKSNAIYKRAEVAIKRRKIILAALLHLCQKTVEPNAFV